MAEGRQPRISDWLSRSGPAAILFREAARTSRRWQTYAARALFSGVLIAVVVLGLELALGASRSTGMDAADLGEFGRQLFYLFAGFQLAMAMVLAPLNTAAAIVEETTDRTFDLLALTRLTPGQIFSGKVISRILVLLTLVLGAMPVLALVVNFGGVSTTEVLALTVHTLVNVVIMGLLGAFFGLFTRAPLLAMMASNAYALPFFVILPLGYAVVTGRPENWVHVSTLSAWYAEDATALLPALAFVPSVVVILRLGAPLFGLQVAGADFEEALSNELWGVSRGVVGFGIWLGLAVFTFPLAGPVAWAGNATVGSSLGVVPYVLAYAWIFAMFSALLALGTWAYLRVAIDVVDGIDGIFSGSGQQGRVGAVDKLRTSPVWWREARFRAWVSSAAPILVTWGLALLAIFQTGTWLAPGVLLGIGVANTSAVLVLTAWLASRTVADERRRGTLETLLVTTLATPRIVGGKAAGAMLPTLPLMLVGLPMITFGYAYYEVFARYDVYGLDAEITWSNLLDGAMMWAWAVPVWASVAVFAMTAAVRLRKPRSAFGLTLAVTLLGLGWTPVVGRLLPDLPLIAPLARLVAPPLAGGASEWQLWTSLVLWAGVALGGFWQLSGRLRGWVGAALAVALAWGIATPDRAVAQPTAEQIAAIEKANGLRVRARPFAEGLSRADQWSQLLVTVENAGPAVRGGLTYEEPTTDGVRTYRRDLEVPEQGRKTVAIPVRRGPSPTARVVRFQGRRRRGVGLVRWSPQSDESVLIGVVGREPLGLLAAVPDTWTGVVPRRSGPSRDLDYNDGAVRQVRAGMLPLATLPEFGAGYDALDWVVWPSADPSRLSLDQTTALLDWVADGGHLFITVTDTWRAVASSPIGEALPVTLEGLGESELAPLMDALGSRGTGRAPVATGSLRDDRSVVGRVFDEGGHALWAKGPFGLGSIHVVLADLAVQPLSQADRRVLWRRLLYLPAVGATGQDRGRDTKAWPVLDAALHLDPDRSHDELDDEANGHGEYRIDPEAAELPIRSWLSDIPNLSPLPVEWLVTFGVVYLLWIGPLDYLVLRGLRRQPWTWVTFPVVIVVFAGLALVLAARLKGDQAVLTRVERIDVLPDAGRWRGDTWTGLFSTDKTAVTLWTEQPDGLVTPGEDEGFVGSPRYAFDGGRFALTYDAETWSFGYAHTRWMVGAQGTVVVTWTDDGVTVSHDLPVDLMAGAIHDGDETWSIGAVPRGVSVTVTGAERTRLARHELLERIEGFPFDEASRRGGFRTRGQAWFVGIAEASVETIGVDGLSPQTRPLTVFRQAVPARDAASPRRPVFMVTLTGEVQWARLVCRDQTSVVRVTGGQARLPLPEGIEREDPNAGCKLEVAPPLAGWFSGVEVSIERPNRCTVTDRDLTCEST